MGLRDIGKRLRASVDELDNVRLQGRFVGKELQPIEGLPLRAPVRVGGEVTRMRITPRSGTPALEVVVSDGTGDLTVVFTGRRSIGGMYSTAKRILVGKPIPSADEHHQRLRKFIALPVFASDALSSVAYATGEIFIQLTIVSLAFKQLVMTVAAA